MHLMFLLKMRMLSKASEDEGENDQDSDSSNAESESLDLDQPKASGVQKSPEKEQSPVIKAAEEQEAYNPGSLSSDR